VPTLEALLLFQLIPITRKMDPWKIFYLFLGVVISLIKPAWSEGKALVLSSENYQDTLDKNKVVLLNFYADWCHFSAMLSPIYDQAAAIVHEEFSDAKLAKLDCEANQQIAMDNMISKYPTLKVFRNGKVQRYEYRGQRSVDAFTNFVRQQMKSSLNEYTNKDEFKPDTGKRTIVGYFESKLSDQYKVFEAVADDLRESCDFWAGVGEASASERAVGEHVIFKPPQSTGEGESTYPGDLNNLEVLKEWAQDKCVPLIREITFENGEALTEEGLPFLLLFHKPGDAHNLGRYKNAVMRELLPEKGRVNFLTADGTKFSHPLHHLGKSVDDLPLICIDSFRHMYLFKKFEDIDVPGKLKEFIADLHSGKLHMDFHNPPPEETEEEKPGIEGDSDQAPPEVSEDGQPPSSDGDPEQPPSDKTGAPGEHVEGPPETVFHKLAPSENRYTLLRNRDEL